MAVIKDGDPVSLNSFTLGPSKYMHTHKSKKTDTTIEQYTLFGHAYTFNLTQYMYTLYKSKSLL